MRRGHSELHHIKRIFRGQMQALSCIKAEYALRWLWLSLSPASVAERLDARCSKTE